MEEKYIEENSRYTKEIHELKQKINELELSDIDLQQFNEKINFYKEELLKCRTFNLDLIRKLINKIIIHQDYGRLTIEILYKCYF